MAETWTTCTRCGGILFVGDGPTHEMCKGGQNSPAAKAEQTAREQAEADAAMIAAPHPAYALSRKHNAAAAPAALMEAPVVKPAKATKDEG